LSIFQYADDTILFFDHDIEQAKNLKLLLGTFEKLSGLKINFHKSELFFFGQAKEFEEQYSYHLVAKWDCTLFDIWTFLCITGSYIGN
jgi:hypothetical protein